MTDNQVEKTRVELPISGQADHSGVPALRTYSRKHRSCLQEDQWQCTASPTPGRDLKQAAFDSVQSHHCLQSQNPPPPKLKKRSFIQLHLDAGQANFACTMCSICGLVYAKGEANDEKVHASFHAKFTVGLKFQGWQHERIVKWDARQGRVLLVLHTDPATHFKKVREICSLVEEHLGLCKGWLLSTPCQVYLYIGSSKHVLGCLVTEHITSASPVIPSLDSCFDSTATSTDLLCMHPLSTPMSAPPHAKHKHLSSQLDLHTPSSAIPVSHSAFTRCSTGAQFFSWEQPASTNHAQQYMSVGSSQSTLVASPGVMLHCQPARKQPKQNGLTKWLATSQCKAAAAQSLHSSLQPDSPTSASSAAVLRREGEELHAAVDSRPAEADISGPFPLATLADVTNVLPACTGSEGSSMTQKPVCLEESLNKSAGEETPAGWGDHCQESQRQLQKQAVAAQHTYQQHECRLSQTGKHPADSQQPSGGTGLLLASCNVKQAAPAEAQQQMLKELKSAVVKVNRENPLRAACGIKVIWVSSQARRRGIATLLLDTARCNCIAGYVVPRSQLAFTQPTQAGRQLAEHYTQSRSFLVY